LIRLRIVHRWHRWCRGSGFGLDMPSRAKVISRRRGRLVVVIAIVPGVPVVGCLMCSEAEGGCQPLTSKVWR